MVMRTAWIASTLVFFACASVAAEDEAIDDRAPDFALKSTTGPNLRLSEYRGEIVMLAFWASWCGECRAQLQSFNDLHARYRDIGFRVLAVNLDPKMAQAQEAAAQLDLTFPVLHDSRGTVGALYDVDELPLVVFVDRDGRVREIVEGYNRGKQDYYADRARALLRE